MEKIAAQLLVERLGGGPDTIFGLPGDGGVRDSTLDEQPVMARTGTRLES